MLIKEFRGQIKRGLGSALLFLKANPEKASKYSKAILDACTHVTSYDPQCEGSRALYLWEAVQLSGDSEDLQEKILDALSQTEGPDIQHGFDYSQHLYEIEQMFELAKHFALNGNERAIEVMKHKFGFYTPWNICIGSEDMLEVFGIEGLRRISQIIGEKILNEDYEEYDGDISRAKEILGEETVKAFFDEEGKTDPRIKAYIDSVNGYRDRITPYKRMTLDEVRANIHEKQHHAILGAWGRKATDEEINILANEFLMETDRKRLIAYMWLFRRRVFPLQIDKLLKLAKENGRTRDMAVGALSNIKDTRLHELGVELLQEKPPKYEAICLFEMNYKPEDHELLAKLFINKSSYETAHWLGMSLLGVYEKNQTPDCLDIMLHLYHKGYCSCCRKRCIKIMMENHILPEWIAEEAAYDSNEDIRKMIREYRSSAMV